MIIHSLLLFLSLLFSNVVRAQDDLSTCSATRPCFQGCCSKDGNCGFTPSHCGTGCQSNCDAKAECGQYAPAGKKDCPINVCCSQFGYCGTTPEFCGTGCQKNSKGGGCGQAKRPSCSKSTDAMKYKRRIGYYELFNLDERLCDKVFPEDLEVAPLTHINLAFVLFDGSFKLIDKQGELISRVSFLKFRYAGLKVMVAIGGWAFNDPPKQTLFSDMASTRTNREIFIGSLVSFLLKYGLDGVDIDWEYPGALDRGGIDADVDNFVQLMSEIKDAFARENTGWEASITLPTSYWYLRHFDINRLQKYVSFFNLMSYDLHGMWDEHNKFTGPYLQGHTNVTEIDQGLDLLWRNDIDPANVVMGFAFYGRSFTMSDSSCSKPGCTFSTSGRPGTCTNAGGILSYSEINSRNRSLSTQTFYDQESTVKYNVYEGNQWISYDDAQSFTDKKQFLTSRCLSGLMIWAIDQDNQNHDALQGLLGDYSSSQLEGGGLDDKSAEALSNAFGAYTGQDCFVTPTCTDGSNGQKQNDQVCPSGSTSVSTAHTPLQASGRELHGVCAEGWYRHICCPTKSLPKNCAWNGAPERSAFGCSGKCGKTQFLLNTDAYLDDKGKGSCFTGTRSLCCDSTTVIDDCFWTSCQGPLSPSDNPKCPADSDFQTYRFDQDNSDWCSSTYVGLNGAMGSPLHDRFKRAFCCPKGKGFRNCNWSNNPRPKDQPGGIVPYDPEIFCKPQHCGRTQTQVTEALEPPQSGAVNPTHTGISCDGVSTPPGYSLEFPYCCDPPSKYSKDWPVDPKYLFANYYNGPEDDVMWNYDNEFRNNNADSSQSPPGDESGTDAYGFVMLDGPPGSLDNDFPSSNTITRRTIEIPKMKRSMLTRNSTLLDSNFEHAEEIIYIYCNYPQDSPQCQKIWYDGAEDTIIRLPDHVGEGPYARVVSMELAEEGYQLPKHHIESRSMEGNTNPIYKIKFDYDFHLIKRADPVNMRVDFTNLLGYWDELTDEPASKKVKRDAYSEHLSNDQWRSKIGKAKRRHAELRKRKMPHSQGTTTTDMSPSENNISKRWFGTFLGWLGRLTAFENKEIGFLSMAFKKSILLFKAAYGCPGQTFSADMKMYLDADVEMEATYAYYFSGTVIPPAVTGTYAYFSLEPSAYLGLRIVGNARLQASTGRKKLLDTISYPGLAIKGLAAVGPTLDLYGEIRGVVTLRGEMKAGAKVKFGKAEVYWPQDDKASDKYQTLLGIKATPEAQSQQLVQPTFDVKVQIDAQVDVLVTPEANMGLRIGGKISGGQPLVDAQLVGYVNTTLSFQASATGSAGSSAPGTFVYRYGVYLYYNIGYGAYATIKLFPNWALAPRNAFKPTPRFTIYEKTDSFGGATKRSIEPPEVIQLPRRGLLDNDRGLKLTPAAIVHPRHDPVLYADTDESQQNSTSSIDVRDLLGKRADSDSSLPDAQTPDFSSQLTCPPGDPNEVRLPDFRLNCNIFTNNQLSGTGAAGQNVDGICQGIQRFFTARGLANSDIVLTWDVDTKRGDKRRADACGRQYCTNAQNLLRQATGDRTIEISCDEFPFASSEEGGNYYNTLPVNPTRPQLTCVPAWQNTLQGNCNKILSNLYTNIAHYKPGGGDNSVKWDAGGWTSLGNVFNDPATPQRLAAYPNQVPQTVGVPTSDYEGANKQLGMMFKRNITFGLASPQRANDGAAWVSGGGTATSWTLTDEQFPVGTDGSDLTAIACAVNIFGQNNIFGYQFNGLCFNGGLLKSGRGFQTPESFSRCLVEFASGGAPTKRSIGKFNGWDVTSIKMRGEPIRFDDVDAAGAASFDPLAAMSFGS